MSEEVQEPKYHQTIDFDTLMRTAREHITNLAGQIWSDHNASDPGITQLEVLAFCIADLSYRTSFGVDDILAGYKGGQMTAFDLPLANVILPNNPVTIKDLRKVLIDMEHPSKPNTLLLRNAFPVIAEQTEIPFYAVSPEGKEAFLSFTDLELFEALNEAAAAVNETSRDAVLDDVAKAAESPLQASGGSTSTATTSAAASSNNSTAANDQSYYNAIGLNGRKAEKFDHVDRIQLNGLYSLQLEFEDGQRKEVDGSDIRRDVWNLNQNYFTQEVITTKGSYELSVLLPYWDDIRWSLKDLDLNASSTTLTYHGREISPTVFEDYFIAVDKLNYDDYFYNFYAELALNDHIIPAFIKVKTRQKNSITLNGKSYQFDVDFLDWNELSNGVKRIYSNALPIQANAIDAVKIVQFVGIGNQENIFDIRSAFTFDKNGNDKTVHLLTRIVFTEGTLFSVNDHGAVENALENKFAELYEEQIAIEAAIFQKIRDKTASIYSDYQTKLTTVFTHLYGGTNNVWSHLGQFRNLCEDYSKFTASRVQEIALFGKLSVLPDYNVSKLLAEIYFRIDQFLNPLIKFKTLDQMTDKGYKFEELFNGPLLKNGFVEDGDLENLKRRSVVYTSDLIRIIMDVEGVLSVEGFNISSYIDNRLMGRNVINCLSLTNSEIYKPRLSLEKSALQVCVNDQMEAIDFIDLENWFLKKLADFKTDQIPEGEIFELSLPMGEDMEIEKYHSIQNDFPEIYGIGPYGLPADATDERRAQAKQLKAYLLPFEQLMTNYLKQVAHLPELFSFNRTIENTYAYQPLYDVPDVQPLFTDFAQNGGITWDQFKLDMDNSYALAIDAAESPTEFKSRRNRFLNQLLSRFGESFTAYSRQMFDRHKALLNDPTEITNYLNARGETQDKLIEDQIAFGLDHEKVSSQRYKSFDITKLDTYQPVGIWNNNNIESYKLRLCRLLGIENVNNSFIFGSGVDTDGTRIDIEGLHVVEHILLRPRTATAFFLDINNRKNEDGSFVYDADKDPYSFKITLVLPKYAGRFKEEAFRKFAEHLIRMETPAHITVAIDWMSSECGQKFEKEYSEWKKGAHKLKPYFFQNITSDSQINHTGLKIDIPGPGALGQVLDPDKLTSPIQHIANKSVEKLVPQKSVQKIVQQKAVQRIVQQKSVQKIVQKKAVKRAAQAAQATSKTNYGHVLRDKKGESILAMQNALIYRLNTPCSLSLKVYDNHDIIMNPIGRIIEFEQYKKDVYNIRVSETGGVLTLYKWDQTEGDWVGKMEHKSINELYFNVSLFIADDDGLTTEHGGQGAYKLVYQMDDLREVAQIIRVTKPIVKPHIFIGWQLEEDGQMLNFDTENDGVFRISNRTWKGYFLQFSPTNWLLNDGVSAHGSAFISSTSKGLSPTLLSGGRNGLENVLLSDIYAQYGKGQYQIRYEIDGQVTFAEIDLFIELSIKVFNLKTELFESYDGRVIVPSEMRKIDLLFDVPNGSLKVYDLDGVSRLLQEGRNNFNEFDGNPFGTIAFHKHISYLLIDRDGGEVYQDGHAYRFEYQQEGLTVNKVIYFQAPEVKMPTIEFLNHETVINREPFIFRVDDPKAKYQARFNPKNSAVTVYTVIEGEKRIIDGFVVTQDDYIENMELSKMYRDIGEGPYFIENTNAAGTVVVQFTLESKVDDRIPEINIIVNGEVLKEMPFLLDPRKDEGAIQVNELGGILKLISEDGRILLEVEEVKELRMPIDIGELGKLSKGQPIRAIYQLAEKADDLEFSVLVIHDPEPLMMAVFSNLSERRIEPKDDIYELVFDYKKPKQYFEFKFSLGPGELMLLTEDGDEYMLPIDSDYIRFNGFDKLPKGLISGDYNASYTAEDGQTIEFKLNVINLNPTFVLTKIDYERPNYVAVAVPLKAKAQSYIWRIDGEYISRAKTPQLKLNFGRGKTLDIQLTLHLEDSESNYNLKVNRDQIKEMRDEQ
ncbi:MAG: hypothetical protein GQ574_02650 [Crocinitomix sp.]|nr:hypothetical protein [Crocinitomix sp.]